MKPEQEAKRKFYTFEQNNSGGIFHYDERAGISVFVIVEAKSADEANARAEKIGLYWNGCASGHDCDCCGDRWYIAYGYDGKKIPEVFGKNVLNEKEYFKWINGYEGFIHYLNGKVVPFWGTKTKRGSKK